LSENPPDNQFARKPIVDAGFRTDGALSVKRPRADGVFPARSSVLTSALAR
jgi:hypothetical protein